VLGRRDSIAERGQGIERREGCLFAVKKIKEALKDFKQGRRG